MKKRWLCVVLFILPLFLTVQFLFFSNNIYTASAQPDHDLNSTINNDRNPEIDANNVLVKTSKGEWQLVPVIDQAKPLVTYFFQLNKNNINTTKDSDQIQFILHRIEEMKKSREYLEVQPNYIYRTAQLNTWLSDEESIVPEGYGEDHWYFTESKLPQLFKAQECPSSKKCGGSEEVVIAVVDSGLAYTDFDDTEGLTDANFKATPVYSDIKLYENNSEIPDNGLDDDCNGYVDDFNGIDSYAALILGSNTCEIDDGQVKPIDVDDQHRKVGKPVDTYGHGTMVTGLISTSKESFKDGSISAAFNTKIMPIAANIHFEDFFTTQTVAKAIDYAIENNADIINLSLNTVSDDDLIRRFVEKAIEEGVLVVAAAGNANSAEDSYPAAYEGVLTAGAVNEDGSKAFYSNYGDYLEVVAYVGDGPLRTGSAVYQNTLDCFGDCNYQNVSDGFSNRYAVGTSFAAPQVSALAAIIKSRDSSLTPEQIIEIIKDNTIDVYVEGVDEKTGYGAINFLKAYNSLNVADYKPVYRFWNPEDEKHFYTIKEQELITFQSSSIFNPWELEGIGFYAYDDLDIAPSGISPVYVFWNPEIRSYFYTISSSERRELALNNPQWEYRGLAFFAEKEFEPGTTPLYRFWSEVNKTHFYTTSIEERNYVQDNFDDQIWFYEGIAFYVIDAEESD